MKTLFIKYTPRNERSKSKVLLDAFREEVRNSEIEELDLCVEPPELFTVKSTEAYYERNMMGKSLPDKESPALATMLRMTAQLKSADIVTVAFPMFNFCMPASVKAWFDSVVHVGETIDPSGGVYRGMMTGKKALVLVAAGGIYSAGNGIGPHFGPSWEHAVSLAKLEFQLMGYSEIRGVLAEGMAIGDETATSANLLKAVGEVRAIARDWYK